jgi:hypothetical protein
MAVSTRNRAHEAALRSLESAQALDANQFGAAARNRRAAAPLSDNRTHAGQANSRAPGGTFRGQAAPIEGGLNTGLNTLTCWRSIDSLH